MLTSTSTSIRAALVLAVLGGAACSATSSAPAGTVLSGRVTFSPDTDALTKFAFPAGAPPSLALLDNAGAAGTDDACCGIVLEDGQDHGALAWQFRAPDGETFEGLQFSDVVLYVDPSAAATATATATLLDADDASDALLLAATAGDQHASPDDLEQWIGGRTSFIVQFALATTTTAAAGDATAVQALRRCPADPVPFSMAVITSSQL